MRKQALIGKSIDELKEIAAELSMPSFTAKQIAEWIYKKKILVGNRDLLINHDIAVPKQAYEEKYTRKGRKALYLAVAGKIMAMFIVSYSGNTKMEHALKKLEKSGMTILLHSCDPYINEDSVAELFHLPAGYVRVMNSASGRVFEQSSDLHVE